MLEQTVLKLIQRWLTSIDVRKKAWLFVVYRMWSQLLFGWVLFDPLTFEASSYWSWCNILQSWWYQVELERTPDSKPLKQPQSLASLYWNTHALSFVLSMSMSVAGDTEYWNLQKVALNPLLEDFMNVTPPCCDYESSTKHVPEACRWRWWTRGCSYL